MSTISIDHLAAENEELRRRLSDLEAEVQAIRRGEVDALLVHAEREQVYTLETPYAPYRLVVAQIPHAAATLTREGAIITCNGRFVDLLRRPESEVVGRSFRELVHRDGLPTLEAWLEKGYEEEVETALELVRADGARMDTHLSARPLKEGALGRTIVVVDVTQQRQYEELQRTQHALREADRRKDEFLATLAHELRNPLAPIRNALQILDLKMPKDPELQWARGVIDRQVELMARLLDDLLDVSRVALLKPELHREVLSLSWVVDAAVESSLPLIEAAGHDLSVTHAEEGLHVNGDPVRLAQIFGNLLNNAAKYTEPRGRIEISVGRRGDEAEVSVKDNGVGLPNDLLPHVFDLFSRAKTAHVRGQGGLGIGLSLVKALVEQHGGSVEAHSGGAGSGSEFVVRLPLVPNAPTEKEDDQARTKRALRATRRVLVVDDNRDNADSLTILMRMWGHAVENAYDGPRALEAAGSFRPDVVFLDIGMSGMDGYEVCRRLRREPWGRGAFIVALTGLGQDDDRRRSHEAGFDDHLVKPVDLRALGTLLESLEERMAGRDGPEA